MKSFLMLQLVMLGKASVEIEACFIWLKPTIYICHIF